MKFNMYGRTPRGKTPKWITIFLISFFACLAALFFMVGIVISIDIQIPVNILYHFVPKLLISVYFSSNCPYTFLTIYRLLLFRRTSYAM